MIAFENRFNIGFALMPNSAARGPNPFGTTAVRWDIYQCMIATTHTCEGRTWFPTGKPFNIFPRRHQKGVQSTKFEREKGPNS